MNDPLVPVIERLRACVLDTTLAVPKRLSLCDKLAQCMLYSSTPIAFSSSEISREYPSLQRIQLWSNIVSDECDTQSREAFLHSLDGALWDNRLAQRQTRFSMESLPRTSLNQGVKRAVNSAGAVNLSDFAFEHCAELRRVSSVVEASTRLQREVRASCDDDFGAAIRLSWLEDGDASIAEQSLFHALAESPQLASRPHTLFADPRPRVDSGVFGHDEPMRTRWLREALRGVPLNDLTSFSIVLGTAHGITVPFREAWNIALHSMSSHPDDRAMECVALGAALYRAWAEELIDRRAFVEHLDEFILAGGDLHDCAEAISSLAIDGVDVCKLFRAIAHQVDSETLLRLFCLVLGRPQFASDSVAWSLGPAVGRALVVALRSRCLSAFISWTSGAAEALRALACWSWSETTVDDHRDACLEYTQETLAQMVARRVISVGEAESLGEIRRSIVSGNCLVESAVSAPALLEGFKERPLWDWLHHAE